MTLGELTAICSVVGAAGGGLIGYGIAWGSSRSMLKSVREGHANLKKEFISHKDDRAIHIDPPRDSAAMIGLKEFISDKITGVTDRLDKIDSRCEGRGADCAKHFAAVERRIAAATGKANGET